MAQFDVYLNPLEDLRQSHPFVIEIQSNLLKRTTLTLVRKKDVSSCLRLLRPMPRQTIKI